MCKEVKPLANGDLYAIEDYDDVIFVVINSESDFFRSMYSRAAQHSNEQDLLDLMIFAIAYAEADRSNSEEMDEFWQQTRSTVSSLSHIFVLQASDFTVQTTPCHDAPRGRCLIGVCIKV